MYNTITPGFETELKIFLTASKAVEYNVRWNMRKIFGYMNHEFSHEFFALKRRESLSNIPYKYRLEK